MYIYTNRMPKTLVNQLILVFLSKKNNLRSIFFLIRTLRKKRHVGKSLFERDLDIHYFLILLLLNLLNVSTLTYLILVYLIKQWLNDKSHLKQFLLLLLLLKIN